MKKYLKKLILALGFSSCAMSAHAGLPVLAAVTDINLIISYVQQGLDYAKQIQQYATQLEELTTANGALNAIIGPRGMAVLADAAALRQAIPSSAHFDLKTAGGAVSAVTQATNQLNSAVSRVSMLAAMQTEIDNSSGDAKSSADLGNRINVENSRLLNEQIMLQVAKDKQAAQAAVLASSRRANAQTQLLGSDSIGF